MGGAASHLLPSPITGPCVRDETGQACPRYNSRTDGITSSYFLAAAGRKNPSIRADEFTFVLNIFIANYIDEIDFFFSSSHRGVGIM